MELGHIFEMIALGVEAAAVAVIVVGIIVATIFYIYRLLGKHNATETFGDYRHGLARTLLLSLEFLVAADIVEPHPAVRADRDPVRSRSRHPPFRHS